MSAYKKLNSGFLPFVQKTMVTSPFTDIQNRAKVDASLKCIMGNERIHVNSLRKLAKESGPNGEPVFEPDNGDARVRFVGGWRSEFNSNGLWVNSEEINDYVEVTFYGTGLNLVTQMDNSANPDWRATVDGGVEGANLYIATSNILAGRNYKQNTILAITSGLSLEWHTVKIRNNENVSSDGLRLFGFEIINEASQITVKAGKAHGNGYEYELAADQLIDYKLGFANVADVDVGTKGGRVIVYLDPMDGTVKKALTKVDDQVTGNPLAPELVGNGTFDTDLTGWTNLARATWDASGRLYINATSGSGARQAERAITTVIGTTYTLTFDFENVANVGDANAAAALIYTGANATGTELGKVTSGAASGTLTLSFVAQTTTSYVFLSLEDNGDAAYFDNVSVKEASFNFLALEDTDHSLEAPYRVINFREFGRNRGDDFSTLTGSNSTRAFTLDDGTTTLLGNSVSTVAVGGHEGVDISTSGDSLALTFVGTGLDIVSVHNNSGNEPNPPVVYIDGVSIGQLGATGLGAGITQKDSICSGLPYGTHTVKIIQEGANLSAWSRFYMDFIVHQPKKSTLPEGAVEIGEYNIMADYIAIASSNNDINEEMSVGVLRKTSNREAIYSGTWITNGVADLNKIDGFDVTAAANGAYVERYFFGTGFEWRAWAQTGGDTGDILVTLDDSNDFTSFTTSTFGSDVGFVAATGVLDFTVSANGQRGLSVSGLSLEWHKVRFTKQSGSRLHGGILEVITPIHTPHTTFGSRSIKDVRNFDSAKDVNKTSEEFKSQAKFNLSAASIYNSLNISQILRISAGEMFVWFEEPYSKVASLYGMHNNDGGVDWDSGSTFESIYLGKAYQKINTLTAAGGVVDATTINANWIETLEKDELEE